MIVLPSILAGYIPPDKVNLEELKAMEEGRECIHTPCLEFDHATTNWQVLLIVEKAIVVGIPFKAPKLCLRWAGKSEERTGVAFTSMSLTLYV